LEANTVDETQRINNSLNNLNELLTKRTNSEVWEAYRRTILQEFWVSLEPLKQKQDALAQQHSQLDGKMTAELNQLRK